MTRGLVMLAVLLAAGLGCNGEPNESLVHDGPGEDLSDEMPEDLPAGECRAGDTDTEDCEMGSSSGGGSGGSSSQDGAGAASECAMTEECSGAGACAASWEEGGRTPFSCRFTCIPTLDEGAWCRDDASCCDVDAVCTGRGYCVVPQGSEGLDNIIAGPKLSDEMPEDLPAGGGTPGGWLIGKTGNVP